MFNIPIFLAIAFIIGTTTIIAVKLKVSRTSTITLIITSALLSFAVLETVNPTTVIGFIAVTIYASGLIAVICLLELTIIEGIKSDRYNAKQPLKVYQAKLVAKRRISYGEETGGGYGYFCTFEFNNTRIEYSIDKENYERSVEGESVTVTLQGSRLRHFVRKEPEGN